MLRLLLALLLVVLATVAGCKDECKLSPKPTVVEVPLGLAEPLTCNDAGDYKCCAWTWDGCMHTFCADHQACAWKYTSGIRVDGTRKACPVPDGYVLVEVTRPDWL